jgi:hypothetical protein
LEKNASINVVLATTGQARSLETVIDTILNQTREIQNLYIVWNSLKDPNRLSYLLDEIRVQIILKGEVNGAAAAYNLGIRKAIQDAPNFICLAADDDKWHFEKIEKQVKFATPRRMVFTSAVFQNEYHRIVRPKSIFPNNQSPLKTFYTKKSVFRYAKHYLPISSIMFPIEASSLKFEESLKIREDIYWLDQAYQRGFEIYQIPDVLIEVGSDYIKASNRESRDDVIKFLALINDCGIKKKFMMYTLSRPSILVGDTKKLNEIHLLCHELIKVNVFDRIIMLKQHFVCVLIDKAKQYGFGKSRFRKAKGKV